MVRVPLKFARLRQTGEMTVKAETWFLVRTTRGSFEPLLMLVDTGANITTIPVPHAINAGVAIPTRRITLDVQTATGVVRQQVHPGYIQVRVPGISHPHPFEWPCHFVDQPGVAPPISVLGLSGVLDDLRLTFDGTYSLDARYGVLLVEPVASDQS